MPTPVYSSSFRQHLYMQAQASIRAIANTSGTWTNTGAQAILYEKCDFTPNNPLIDPPFKTGNASDLMGVRGRSGGGVSFSAPYIPSGAAGTVPNLDLLTASAFGMPTGVVVASTSVTYAFTDAIKPLLLLKYDEGGGSNPTNMYSMGTLPTRLTWQLNGQGVLMCSSDMASVGIGDSDNFAAYTGPDAALKGGLTTYPAEPSPTVTGNIISDFGGVVIIDGQTIGEVRGGLAIEIVTGYTPIPDGFADGYTLAFLNGKRKMTLSDFTVLNSDSTALQNVKQKAYSKTGVSVLINLGSVAGQVCSWALNRVQFPQGAFQDNGPAVDVKFSGAAAHATFGSTNDGAFSIT